MTDDQAVSQEEFKTHVLNFLQEIEKYRRDPMWSILIPEHGIHRRTAPILFFFDSIALPARVRLVVNTNIGNATMGENPEDVAATMAMRSAAQVDT